MIHSILVPIFICVVLPVSVVLIVSLQRRNSDNKRAEILIKAIETNKNIDVDRLTEAMSNQKTKRTPEEIRNRRLLLGSIFTLLGLLFIVIGLVAWSQLHSFDSDSVTVSLMMGGASLAVGVGFLIVYFVTGKTTTKEIRD